MSQGSPLLSDERFCRGFFCAAYLFLGLLSFVFKILLPILTAVAQAYGWLAFVTWDMWWATYLFIGWKMQYPSKKVWEISLGVAVSDFIVSSWRIFSLTRTDHIWDFWRTSMFFQNLFSFAVSFLFFFYLFSYSTRKEFSVLTMEEKSGGLEKKSQNL